MVELTTDDLNYLSEFHRITAIYPKHYVNTELAIVFLVENKGELYKSLGKKGSNLSQLSKSFGKTVFILVDSSNLEEMVKNSFHSLDGMDLKVDEREDGKYVTLVIREEDRGRVVGRGGARIKAVRELLKERFNVKNFQLRTTRRLRVGDDEPREQPE